MATLTTSARDQKLIMHGDKASIVEGDGTGPQQETVTAAPEKVAVSNNGENLVLDISGKPGRFVADLYKLKDKKGAEQTFIHKIDQIRKSGVASIATNLAQGLDKDIPFMVVTSDTPRFNSNNRGTDWFSARINSAPPEPGNLPKNYATDPDGEHQKVVMYGIGQIQRRSFAPLKRL